MNSNIELPPLEVNAVQVVDDATELDARCFSVVLPLQVASKLLKG